MAQIAVSPLVMKEVLLEIGLDNYEKHVSAVVFTPSSSQITWKGLAPADTFTDVTTATWVLDLTYVQDWGTTNSLSQYLMAHEGETIAVEFRPKSGTGPSFTASVTITPGAIGGQVDTFAETTVSLGSTKPVLVPAP